MAGVLDEAEARMLLAAGATDLGFPVGPGVVEEDLTTEQVARLVAELKIAHQAVIITYLNDPESICACLQQTGAKKVQLHGEISVEALRSLRAKIPTHFILKSLIVGEEDAETLEHAVNAYAPYVDAFITDTFDPVTGHRGMTGQVHDWKVSRKLVALSPRPILLAGGLHPDNVAQAVREVRPAGVDVHTGVEAPSGRKDPDRVRRFVKNALAGHRT